MDTMETVFQLFCHFVVNSLLTYSLAMPSSKDLGLLFNRTPGRTIQCSSPPILNTECPQPQVFLNFIDPMRPRPSLSSPSPRMAKWILISGILSACPSQRSRTLFITATIGGFVKFTKKKTLFILDLGGLRCGRSTQ